MLFTWECLKLLYLFLIKLQPKKSEDMTRTGDESRVKEYIFVAMLTCWAAHLLIYNLKKINHLHIQSFNANFMGRTELTLHGSFSTKTTFEDCCQCNSVMCGLWIMHIYVMVGVNGLW